MSATDEELAARLAAIRSRAVATPIRSARDWEAALRRALDEADWILKAEALPVDKHKRLQKVHALETVHLLRNRFPEHEPPSRVTYVDRARRTNRLLAWMRRRA